MKRYVIKVFIILLFSSPVWAGDEAGQTDPAGDVVFSVGEELKPAVSVNEELPSPKRINIMLILPWAVLGTIVISLALYALHLAKSMGKRYSIKKE